MNLIHFEDDEKMSHIMTYKVGNEETVRIRIFENRVFYKIKKCKEIL